MTWHNEIDNILNKEIRKHRTPSVQYVIFNGEEILHSFHAGMADIENQIKTSPASSFHAYSITKTFTALAILQLADNGLIDIEDPVKKYYPGFPYPAEITIRHLLTHTGGIPNPIPISWIHLAEEHADFCRDDFFKEIFIKNPKLKNSPGKKFSYSNLGYVLLGQLIGKVTGQVYEEYIRQHIINPLGLSGEDLDFILHGKTHAKGYHKKSSLSYYILGFIIDRGKFMDKPKGRWRSFRDMYVNGTSYGGLIGTPAAFVKYIRELLQPGSTLLSDDKKQMIFTENHTKGGKPTGMCLSWFTGTLNGVMYYTHAGGGGGYYCEIRLYPSKNIGSVIMFNRTGMSDERFLDKVDCWVVD
jgi:CubicO group peptidase (beta-lactamase class C family)